MPKLKRKARAQNLGSHSQKKPRAAVSEPLDSQSPNVTDSGLDFDEQSMAISRQSDAESILSDLSDLSDENDIPHAESESALLKWLEIGKKKLEKLLTVKQSTERKSRGQYFSTQMDGQPAERTKRRWVKSNQEIQKQHGGGLLAWLKKSSEKNVEPMETSESAVEGEPELQVPETARNRCRVTIEEVEDEEDMYLPPTRSQLSLLEEDGLGDLPDQTDFDDDFETARGNPDSSDPTTRMATSWTPHPITFTHADDSFQYTPSKQKQSTVPLNCTIDSCITKIHSILHPKRQTGRGYKIPDLNAVLRGRLELMVSFLRLYASQGYTGWTGAADLIATAAGRGSWLSRRLREWTIAFAKDNKNLPTAQYGKFNVSVFADEDLQAEIHLHLQGIGKYISASDVVRYLATPEMISRLRLKRPISLRSAQRLMAMMEYRWQKEAKGMYFDGHEREDNVDYRQNHFLPLWESFERRTRRWTKDDEEDRTFVADITGKIVVIWRHDESTFYANDRRKVRPSARILFRAGKNRDGYFANPEVLAHATKAMDILDKDYPDEEHVFAFDNATTHTARAADAVSAKKMPVNPPKVDEGKKNFLCSAKTAGGGTCLLQMRDGRFPDGTPQSFYFPDGHPQAGVFKGMRQIIRERNEKGAGLPNPDNLNAQCTGFKCREGQTACCCRRVLFNQPDFVNQKSALEELCEARGYRVIFFPKYHCELNFIEQCWGYAKRIYREFPLSTLEADLQRNMVKALDSVPLSSMRKFATRSARFMDAYRKGLDGKQAAWASKKYRGHRVLPESILREFELAQAAGKV